MIPLVSVVLMASLTGSLHCAGMCGAFVVTGTTTWPTQVAYHVGRLLTYVAMGAVVGAIGASIDLGGSLLGLQRLALLLAAIAMVVFGLSALLSLLGVRVPTVRSPAFLRRIYLNLFGRTIGIPPVRRSLAIGLLSALLPCGWLYAFVIVSAGGGSALKGAIIMAVFWIGTVPILAAIGVTQQWLTRSRRGVAMVAAVAIVIVGLTGIVGRWQLTLEPPTSETTPIVSIETIGEHTPACCQHDR